MTTKEYKIEVAQLLLSGEWLPLMYLSAYLGRDVQTVRDWARAGKISCRHYGNKCTNLYNVEDAIIVNQKSPKMKNRSRKGNTIADKRKYYFELWNKVLEDRPLCWNFEECKNPSSELAHIVANTKANHIRYGWWAINHEDNIVPSCKRCNAKAMGIVRGDEERKEHIKKIHKKLEAENIDPFEGKGLERKYDR